MSKPLILGLTGSIGMGKSTVAAMFRDVGVPVFDADAEVRAMQGPNGCLTGAIEAAFPGSTSAKGVLRDKLGALVFGDPLALGRLEAIVHPAVRAARAEFLRKHAAEPLVVFDIPLLFERGGAEEVGKVLVVSAPATEQRRRVLAREGMNEEKLVRILALQTPDAEKRARADYVIDTGIPLEQTERAVHALIAELRKHTGH